MTETNDQPAAETKAPELEPIPTADLESALPHLRRPFAPSAIKWKIQASGPKNKPAEYAVIVGYIDARLVVERLNAVVAGNWSEKPIRIEGKANALMYELTVFETTHVDVGVSQGSTDEMKLKAVHSDALKRTAVRFGVGVSLYALPKIFLDVTEDGAAKDGVPTLKRGNDGKPYGLRDAHEAHLRKVYGVWLEQEGEAAFGEPLDHGDASTGSIGDVLDEGEETAAAGEPLADEKAQELHAEIRRLRDEVREIDTEALPQQTFDTALAQREHSHERLEDFRDNLAELLAALTRFAELAEQLPDVMDPAEAKKVIAKANRRHSRGERVAILEEAFAATTGEGGGEGAAE